MYIQTHTNLDITAHRQQVLQDRVSFSALQATAPQPVPSLSCWLSLWWTQQHPRRQQMQSRSWLPALWSSKQADGLHKATSGSETSLYKGKTNGLNIWYPAPPGKGALFYSAPMMSHSCAFELGLFSTVREFWHFLFLALEVFFKNTSHWIVNLNQEQEPSVHTYKILWLEIC